MLVFDLGANVILWFSCHPFGFCNKFWTLQSRFFHDSFIGSYFGSDFFEVRMLLLILQVLVQLFLETIHINDSQLSRRIFMTCFIITFSFGSSLNSTIWLFSSLGVHFLQINSHRCSFFHTKMWEFVINHKFFFIMFCCT
jgi:hypothetical protein